MKTLAEWIVAGVVTVGLGAGTGCAASTDPPPSRGAGGDDTSATNGGGAGGAGIVVMNGGGPSTGGTGAGLGGSMGAAGSAVITGAAGSAVGAGGTFGAAGTGSGSAGTFASGGAAGGSEGGGTTPVGTAVISITAFSLSGCARTVSATDLAAKNNGLTVPKPTQTFSAGTFTVDYTVAGQYGQVGIDFPDPGVDLTGCQISATLSASSWPACGVYAVPFFYDGTLGTVAPYDAGSARFVGEQVSNLSGAAATISFKATGAALTKIGRIGLNIYNCPASVTVGNL